MMYGKRKAYTRRSLHSIKRWRKRLEREHFKPPFYAEMNLFAYRPWAPEVQKAFRRVYELCQLIERDQFLVPYVFKDLKHLRVSGTMHWDLGVQTWNHAREHSSYNR